MSEVAHLAAQALEATGMAVILLGALVSLVVFLGRWWRQRRFTAPYHQFRAELGRGILLGLELLVGADIIATVTLDPTLRDVAVLAAVVAVRTFLSFTLEMEITGRWPWQQRRPPDE